MNVTSACGLVEQRGLSANSLERRCRGFGGATAWHYDASRRSQCQSHLQPENTWARKAMNMIMLSNRCSDSLRHTNRKPTRLGLKGRRAKFSVCVCDIWLYLLPSCREDSPSLSKLLLCISFHSVWSCFGNPKGHLHHHKQRLIAMPQRTTGSL